MCVVHITIHYVLCISFDNAHMLVVVSFDLQIAGEVQGNRGEGGLAHKNIVSSFPDPPRQEKGLVNLGQILGSCFMVRAD